MTTEARSNAHRLHLSSERSRAKQIAEQLAASTLADAQEVASALGALERRGLLELPLPGAGATFERFDALFEIAAIDLSLARLAEGHTDARAILSELGAPARPGLYGVWAADPPGNSLRAERCAGGYRLQGIKRYASGASSLQRALVTARSTAGLQLFDVALASAGIVPIAGSWPALGMAHSQSLDVRFEAVGVPDSAAIGGIGAYLERAGFWHGGVGVAACWYGGALGCARLLHARLSRACDDHAAAHLGSIRVACHAMHAVLAEAARAIDADPRDRSGTARERALLVRGVIERGCEEVLRHTSRATGSSAMVFDPPHARRCADLPVYIRQHHAERDLAELGRIGLAEAACP
jgi:alkylation response protein AidB-like acyl-CoA dehydrogenase